MKFRFEINTIIESSASKKVQISKSFLGDGFLTEINIFNTDPSTFKDAYDLMSLTTKMKVRSSFDFEFRFNDFPETVNHLCYWRPYDRPYLWTEEQLNNISNAIKKIPFHVDALELNFIIYNNNKTIWLKNFLQHIPKNIETLDISKLLTNYTEVEFFEILPYIPPFIKHLKLTEKGKFITANLSDEQLKSIGMALPLSVETIAVPKRLSLISNIRRINLKNFLFPESYHALIQNIPDPYEKAKAILENYTGEDSCILPAGLNLFFKGHWNRHYTDQVSSILSSSTNVEELVANLEKLKVTTPAGSLAYRIRFIKTMCLDAMPSQESANQLSIL